MIRRIDLIPSPIKLLVLLAFDLLSIFAAFFLAYFIRVGVEGIDITWHETAVFFAVTSFTLALFYFFDVYSSVVRYFNAKSFLRIQSLLIVSTITFYLAGIAFNAFVPRSVPIIFLVIASVMIAGARALIGFIADQHWFDEREGVVIYGASNSGRQLVHALSLGNKYQPLAFIDEKKNCGDNCWNRIVDFMHASQWQGLYASDSNYQNMRNHGFPQSVEIIDAVEAYLAQNTNNADTFVILPEYRSIVRQLIDVKPQEFYWANCWSLVDGIEKYIIDCPKGIADEEAQIIVDRIIGNPNIKPQLTRWVGEIVSLPATLGDQNVAANKAIILIKQELERR